METVLRTDKYVNRYDYRAVVGMEKTWERRPYSRDKATKSQRYWMRQQPTLDSLWTCNIVTTAESFWSMNTIRFDPTMYLHVRYHRGIRTKIGVTVKPETVGA